MITNEEAIKYLIRPFATSTNSYNEYLKQKEAYDLAVKVLQERLNDENIQTQSLISRYQNDFVSSQTEVVKVGEPLPNSDEINRALEKGEMYKRGFKEGYKQAIIDRKTNFSRPQGKWVLNCKRYYCSECGEDAIDLESEPDVFASNYCLTNYCPNCGADMRGTK